MLFNITGVKLREVNGQQSVMTTEVKEKELQTVITVAENNALIRGDIISKHI
jgi:hypothetical protein